MKELLSILAVSLTIIFAVVSGADARTPSKNKLSATVPMTDSALTRFILEALPDNADFCVMGALHPTRRGTPETTLLFQTVRIICSDEQVIQTAVRALKDCKDIKIKKLRHDLDKARSSDPAGYRGMTIRFMWQDREWNVQILTFQQLRWLIWADAVLPEDPRAITKSVRSFAIAISDYLNLPGPQESSSEIPRAAGYGLSEQYDLYQPLSDDKIKSPDSVAEITTSFARGITAFVPTDSILREFRVLATNDTYVENNPAMFQWQCREFFSSGHTLQNIKTLSHGNIQEFEPGCHAFIVTADSSIRCAQIADQDVCRWSQLPHAVLSCGQPVLTAGIFSVKRDSSTYISSVNIRSHVLLGDLQAKSEPRQLSDRRLISLGHFFAALDQLGIPYRDILISKF